MAGLLADGVGLSLVLGHSGVNLLDDIRPDRAQEDGRVGVSGTGGRAIGAEDRDGRSRSHFFPQNRSLEENAQSGSGNSFGYLKAFDCAHRGVFVGFRQISCLRVEVLKSRLDFW